jgi:hypothetical protein
MTDQTDTITLLEKMEAARAAGDYVDCAIGHQITRAISDAGGAPWCGDAADRLHALKWWMVD